ncbi:MAG: cyanophycinase [Flavobacteriales bacterium]|nr:cyanophycinase [Flavobacteriales bacterium]
MFKAKGILIPIGGNEDKGDDINRSETETLEFIQEGIISHVVRESGGKDKSFVVIPTASSIPVEVGQTYIQTFELLGCKNVTVLDIRKKADANNPKNLEIVRKSSCVMFSGGDQSKITKIIGGSALHEILTNRYANDPEFVLAGTSAGAMAMSEEMIAGGIASESFVKGTVKMSKGMGWLPQIMIDTHFVQRGRFGRIAQAVAKFPSILGIGLSENTGVVIKNGDDLKVIGTGMVIIFDGSEIEHNSEALLEPGTPMTITNLKVHVLSNSDRYTLSTKKVAVLPIDAPFN